MKLYFSIIGAAMLIVAAANIVCGVVSPLYAVIAVVLCTAAQFAIDGLIAILIKSLPDRLFSAGNPLYTVSESEKRFYKRIKVRLWKDKIWELGGLGGFSKKNLADPESSVYIEKFIIECNKGVLTHRLSYPAGFIVMLFLPGICSFSIALPIAAVNLFLNILPTLALRYNTPKLVMMLQRLERKGKELRRGQESAVGI